MFMHNFAEELSRSTGIQRVHLASGRKGKVRLDEDKIITKLKSFILKGIKTATCSPSNTFEKISAEDEGEDEVLRDTIQTIIVRLINLVVTLVNVFDVGFRKNFAFGRLVKLNECGSGFLIVWTVVITVRALYAGTLVTNRTTAPLHHKLPQSYSILLAALCFILATLTIAARCYASSNTSIVQFSHHNSTLTISPILTLTRDSNTQQLTSKKVLLNKLFPNSQIVQSDISVININNKSNSKQFNNQKSRRKRDSNYSLDNFYDYKSKSKTRSKISNNDAIVENIVSTRTITENSDLRNKHLQVQVPLIPSHAYSVDFPKHPSPNSEIIIEDRTELVPVISASGGLSARNKSANFSRVASTFVVDQDDFPSLQIQADSDTPSLETGKRRPMLQAHDRGDNSLSETGLLVLVVAVVVLTVVLGLVTCVLSHYRGGTAAERHDAAQTPTTAPMLSVVSAGATAGVGGMDRLRSLGNARDLKSRDRQVQLHAVHKDIAINLPPSISLPDGEDHPFNSRLHLRDADQESEIYQKCIRPPPNRTVLDSESPPPYRSSSAGLLGSIGGSSSGSSEWSGGNTPLVVRCHSMSSTSKRPEAGPSGQKTDFIQKTVKIFTGKKSQPSPAPTLPPVVIVPSRTRRTTEQPNSTAARPKPNV